MVERSCAAWSRVERGTAVNSTISGADRLDLRGLKCPLPALRTGKALDAMQHGAQLEVLTTDPMSVIDIPHLVQVRGDLLVSKTATHVGPKRSEYVFLIERVCAD